MTQEDNITGLTDTIRFVLEIDKPKGILRKVKPIGENRYENIAEHSWQIALFALSLAQTLALKVNLDRVIAMLLVHDIGEIDAGDEFVFTQNGWEGRRAAELRAVQRIFRLASPNVAEFLLALWKEFDAGETSEARFAKAIDWPCRTRGREWVS
jgi:putative hydrolase of HD superfamily